MRHLTPILLSLWLIASPAVAVEVYVPDLNVERLDSGGFLYVGHVIDKKSGKPLTSGYVYLTTLNMQIVDGKPIESDGFFEIKAASNQLKVIYSATELASKVVRNQRDPLMEEIEATVMKRFPRQNFGRAKLIIDPQSEIVITEKATLLKRKRDFTDEIVGFDAGDAAADLFFAAQKFKGFKEANLCQVQIPYRLENGVRTSLKHTVVQVTLEPTPGRVIAFYLDPTPFSLNPIVTKWTPQTIVKQPENVARAHLQTAALSVPLSPSAPLLAKGDLQLWGGIVVDGEQVVIHYAIYQIKPVDKTPVSLLKAFDAQMVVPKGRWDDFQAFVKSHPTDFPAKLPEYAKPYHSGSIDPKMKAAEPMLYQVMQAMIVKARLIVKGTMG